VYTQSNRFIGSINIQRNDLTDDMLEGVNESLVIHTSASCNDNN